MARLVWMLLLLWSATPAWATSFATPEHPVFQPFRESVALLQGDAAPTDASFPADDRQASARPEDGSALQGAATDPQIYNNGLTPEEKPHWLNGAFYGVLLTLFCFNLILYLSLRESSYAWFLVLTLNAFLLALLFDGILLQWLPSLHDHHHELLYTLVFTHCLASTQLSRHILQTRRNSVPSVDLALRVWVPLAALLLLGAARFDRPVGLSLAVAATVLNSALLVLCGVYVLRSDRNSGAYAILASGLMLFSLFIAVSGALGQTPFVPHGLAVLEIGLLLKLLILALGLLDCINLIKEEGFRSRQAALQARIQSQAKSRFLAKMSHEIRTPLNGVLGMLHLLKETRLDHSQRFYVDTISSSGGMLMTVINDILDYARIESGKLSLESIEFDLEELVSNTLGLFTAQVLNKRLQLYLSLAPGVPRRIMGDPTRLKQVLTNLLSNAFKFTEAGHVRLSVERQDKADGSPALRFTVSDSGIGIDRKAQARLFESFSQVDSSTTRRYGGSGLGLAISKELVEMMGGHIEVQSTPGLGTRFTFDMPLRPGRERTDELARLLAGRTALLASLDGLALESLGRLLGRWGMRIECCRAAELLPECLQSFSEPPLLVLIAPWPGEIEQWLGALQPPAPGQRVLLLCPPGQGQHLPSVPELSLRVLAQPVTVLPLREKLLELYRTGPSETPPPEENSRENSHEPCILIAEDNPVNQLVVQGLLKKRGYRVRLASNGATAVAEYHRNPSDFQLILMDCEMPELDGFEATRQIRLLERLHQWPSVPIIALTAHVLEEQRAYGTEVGMNDFLGKPLDIQRLYATLDRYLARQPLPDN